MEICPSHRKRGRSILVVEMKMSNGGIKIWYDLLQPSFVIRTSAKESPHHFAAKDESQSPSKSSYTGTAREAEDRTRTLSIKTDGQIIRLRGK